MIKDLAELFIQPILNIWSMFSDYVPNLVAAFIFVLFGLFIARVVSSLLEQFLRRIKLDSYTSSVGINELLIRFGFGKSFSHMVAFIVYWALLLVFFVTAANILNLTAISEILQRFTVVFLPKMVAAIFIGFGGLMFARFMSDVVMNSATANNLRGGRSLSKIVHFVIVVFTLIAAIEQLGIEMKMIRNGVNILFASMGLAFAIAVGLGAKDIAHNIIRGMFTDNKEEK
ncbi:MAG: hypothetical protein A2X35_06865 [Elusimicrobia bacterium GWA2_61_42]|nr:MAG: hypothetical protein A2X35_06865 [Elusimicrobia bacterium GWA2_61_42]OGR78346.1 MAG: hypothetical protein A2X38_05520 [Elusimicrobia bacterium GWC2_61_25]